MQNSNLLTIALIAVAAFLLFAFYRRSATVPGPAAMNAGGGAVPPPSPGPSRPSAGSWSSGVFNSIPGGGYLSTALNRPLDNVVGGNWKDAAGSALTGGGSDFVKKLNPLTWV